MEWWKEAFGPWYPIVYNTRDDLGALKEVESAARWLGLDRHHDVLDLACGGGRHARAMIPLVRSVVGCDLSRDLLRIAMSAGGGPRYVAADQRALPFATSSFDAVACFFTSFGYGESVDHDKLIVEEVRRVIRRGGRFLLDLPHAEYVRSHLVPESSEARGLFVVKCSRRLVGNRVEKTVVVSEGGEIKSTWRESVRLYDAAEVTTLIESLGFRTNSSHSSFNPVATSHDRHIVISEAT